MFTNEQILFDFGQLGNVFRLGSHSDDYPIFYREQLLYANLLLGDPDSKIWVRIPVSLKLLRAEEVFEIRIQKFGFEGITK